MNEIGGVKLTYQEIQELKDLLDVFKTDTDGKEIVKLQIKNGKLEVKYEK